MRAVVMAGGEGTRLRPLTSNQPKPMVSLCGKPCMEHIVELLKRHGIDETVVTLMFLPKVIRDYFGDGSTLGVRMQYSVEQSPAGTAGSVKLAEDDLRDDTFIVISGDALTDFDLQDIVAFHKQRGAMVTIALKRVENPLEFGVVVVNEEGRIERFLEKPTWGQVFSDTVNTGIYVLEPEVFDHIPAGHQVRLQPGAVPQAVRDGRAALRLRRRGLLAGHRQPAAVPHRQPRPARRQGPGRAPRHRAAQPHLPRRRRQPRLAREHAGPRVHRQLRQDRPPRRPSGPTRCSAATSSSRSTPRRATA